MYRHKCTKYKCIKHKYAYRKRQTHNSHIFLFHTNCMTCTGEAITLFNHNIYCCTLQDIDAKLDFRVSKEDKLSV